MNEVYYNLRNAEDKDIVEKMSYIWKKGKYKESTIRNGTKYYVIYVPEDKNTYLIADELYRVIETKIYRKLNELNEKIKKIDFRINIAKNQKAEELLINFLDEFKLYMDIYAYTEKIEQIMKKVPKELITIIYGNFYRELLKCQIDCYNYISKDEIFDQFMINGVNMTKAKENINYSSLLRDLDKEYKYPDSIDRKIEEKKTTRKKVRFCFEKIKLIQLIINDDEEKEEVVKKLQGLKFDEKDVELLSRNNLLDVFIFEKLYNINELREVMLKSVKEMQLGDLMILYAHIDEVELLKYVNLKSISYEKIVAEYKSNSAVNSTVVAVFLKAMYENAHIKLNKREIENLMNLTKQNPIDITRAYLVLLEKGVYEDEEILIDLFTEQVEYENQDKKQEENKIKSRKVTAEELLEYFTPDRVVEKLNLYINQINQSKNEKTKQELLEKKAKFLRFYKWLIISRAELINEDEKEQWDRLIERKIEQIENMKDRLVIVEELYDEDLLENRQVKKYITEKNIDELLELYGNGINDTALMELYKNGIISKENLLDIYEFNSEKITSKSIAERLEKGDIKPKNIVTLYLYGIIPIDTLSENLKVQIDWSLFVKDLNDAEKVEKVGELYQEGIIKFEDLQELKENELISEKQAEIIMTRRNILKDLMKGLKSEQTENKAGTKRIREEGKRRKKNELDIEDKEILLKSLGFNALTNENEETLVVANGSFEGYRVYLNEIQHVILFEGEGASYLTHEHQAQNFIKTQEGQEAVIEGTRSTWRELAKKQSEAKKTGIDEEIRKAEGNKTLRRRIHSKHWGENVISSMVEISKIFMDGSQAEKEKNIKETIEQIKDENKTELEFITGLFEEREIPSR